MRIKPSSTLYGGATEKVPRFLFRTPKLTGSGISCSSMCQPETCLLPVESDMYGIFYVLSYIADFGIISPLNGRGFEMLLYHDFSPCIVTGEEDVVIVQGFGLENCEVSLCGS